MDATRQGWWVKEGNMFIVIAILCLGYFDQPPELLELEGVRGCDVVLRISISRAKGKPRQQPSTYG